jgi:hypothetical protein
MKLLSERLAAALDARSPGWEARYAPLEFWIQALYRGESTKDALFWLKQETAVWLLPVGAAYMEATAPDRGEQLP